MYAAIEILEKYFTKRIPSLPHVYTPFQHTDLLPVSST